MKVFRIVTLAAVLLATAGVSSASATTWSRRRCRSRSGSPAPPIGTTTSSRPGGFGFPGGRYSPIASTHGWHRAEPDREPATAARRHATARRSSPDRTGKVYAFGGLNAGQLRAGPTWLFTRTHLRNRMDGKRSASDPPCCAICRRSFRAASNRATSLRWAATAGVSDGQPHPDGGRRDLQPDDQRLEHRSRRFQWHWMTRPPRRGDAHLRLRRLLERPGRIRGLPQLGLFAGHVDTPGAHWVQHSPPCRARPTFPERPADPTDADGDIYVAGGANRVDRPQARRRVRPARRTWTCIRPMPGSHGLALPLRRCRNRATRQLAVSGGLSGNTVENTVYYTPTGLNTTDVVPPW